MKLPPSLRAALSFTALCGLAVYGCSSAAAAATSSQKSARSHASSPTSTSQSAPPGPPEGSGESIGSSALEHKLDQLEKNIQGKP